MPLPLYGERELWVIPIRASYSIHEGNVSLTPMGLCPTNTFDFGGAKSPHPSVPGMCWTLQDEMPAGTDSGNRSFTARRSREVKLKEAEGKPSTVGTRTDREAVCGRRAG